MTQESQELTHNFVDESAEDDNPDISSDDNPDYSSEGSDMPLAPLSNRLAVFLGGLALIALALLLYVFFNQNEALQAEEAPQVARSLTHQFLRPTGLYQIGPVRAPRGLIESDLA
mmetsp:Transcript_141638/g.353152  ORF Transcript_141638/g.353152 Transcript_141638/m.353152 type:complete len:115 (+) Transcript_141638:98-442(+)